MSDIKTNIRMIKLSKENFDQLCRVQVDMTAKTTSRPSFSEVVGALCKAYLISDEGKLEQIKIVLGKWEPEYQNICDDDTKGWPACIESALECINKIQKIMGLK